MLCLAENAKIGAIAQTIPSAETIDLGNDPELEDAKWFSFAEIREALRVGTSGIGEPSGPEYKEGGLRLPPPTAVRAVSNISMLNLTPWLQIANRLITSIVEDNFVGGTPRM